MRSIEKSDRYQEFERSIDFQVEDFTSLAQGLSVPLPSATEQLQLVQRKDIAWELSAYLLNQPNDSCLFYGAHTLYFKIKTKWFEFKKDEVRRLEIRKYIMEKLVYFIYQRRQTRDMVVIKLFTALILLAFQEFSLGWKSFIQDIYYELQNQAPTDEKDTLSITGAQLLFLKLLAEEFQTIREYRDNSNLLHVYLGTEGRPRAMELVGKFTQIGEGIHISEKLRMRSLDCLSGWVNFGIPASALSEVVDRVIENVYLPGCAPKCIEIVSEVFSHPNASSVADTLYNKILAWLTSTNMQLVVNGDLNDLETFTSLSKLYSSFGLVYVKKVIPSILLGDPAVNLIVNNILLLTDYPGDPSEQEVTFNTVEFWKEVLEATLEVKERHPIGSLEHNQLGQHLLPIVSKAVQLFHKKVSYPEDAELETWSSTERSGFNTFRMEVESLFMDTYFILKMDYFNYLRDSTETLINQVGNGTKCWQELEATLFVINKIYTSRFDPDIEASIVHLMSDHLIGQVLDTQSHPNFQGGRLKNQVLELVSNYIQYVSQGPNLIRLVNRILACLSHPAYRRNASRAFNNVAEQSTEELSDGVDSLIDTLLSIHTTLDTDSLDKMLEAIASLITFKSHELLLARTEKLTSFIVQNLETCLTDPTPSNDLPNLVMVGFQLLLAAAKGINTSTFVDLEVLEKHLPSGDPYSQRMFALTSRSVELFGTDTNVSYAIFKFLNEGIRTINVITPFNFPLPSLLQFLQVALFAFPSEHVLDSITTVFNAYGKANPAPLDSNYLPHLQLLAPFFQSILPLFAHLLNTQKDLETHTTVVHAYSKLLNRVVNNCPHAYLLLPQPLVVHTLEFCLLSFQHYDRTLIKSNSMLLYDVFILEKKEEHFIQTMNLPIVPFVKDLIQHKYGYILVQHIFKAIPEELPCLTNKSFIEMFRKLVSVNKEEVLTWMTTLLQDENFPTPYCSPEVKKKVPSALVGACINSGKFKLLVDNFVMVCHDRFSSSNSLAIFN